jgi:hypothetical protein
MDDRGAVLNVSSDARGDNSNMELISVNPDLLVPVLPSGLKDLGVLPLEATVKIFSLTDVAVGDSIVDSSMLMLLSTSVDTAEARER